MNLPGVEVSAPALSEKDRADLAFAVAHGVDFIALSFVRKPSDVEALRSALRDLGSDAQIIAKLEKPEVLADLDALLAVTDAVMVARGDLGVEMPPEQVPIAQKRIIARCMAFRTPVIVATQMLESMCTNPRPDARRGGRRGQRGARRRRRGDAFRGDRRRPLPGRGGADDGRDRPRGRGLSGLPASTSRRPSPTSASASLFSDAVARAAAETAEHVGADLIAAFTESGFTARLLSKCRSAVPAIAVTPEGGNGSPLHALLGRDPGAP